MANIFTRTLINFALSQEEVQNEIAKGVATELAEEKDKIQKEADEQLSAEKDEIYKKAKEDAIETVKKEWNPNPREFITASNQKLKGDKQETGKSYDTLYRLYADAPGAIQSGRRIIEAVVGQGYVIKPIEGEAGTKRDFKKIIELFDNPNPDMTFEMLIDSGLRNYLAYGDWYIEVVKTKKGNNVAELYLLDTTRMKVLVNSEKKKKGLLEKVGYVRESQGKDIAYVPEQVIQVSAPNPKAGIYGRAVLEDNAPTLTLVLQALTYNINVLKNGGRPPMKIELPEDSTEQEATAVNTFYEKNYVGPQNAGKALVLFKGARAEGIGISPADMSYLDLLNFGIKLVAGQFGVPLILLGFPEGSNRSTATESRRAFYYSVIFPLRKLISQVLTKTIIKEHMGIEGWQVDFRGMGLEESEASRRDTMTAYSKGLLDWNEARHKLGMLPSDKEWADEYYLLSSKNDSMIPVSDAINRPSEDAAPEVTRPENEPGNDQQGEGAEQSEE